MRHMPPFDDPHKALEAAVQAAEDECAAGRWESGFQRYVALVRRRLEAQPAAGLHAATMTAADAITLERTAELAVLLGRGAAADHLLAALSGACRRAGNLFAADCAALKRLHLAISAGSRSGIEEALATLHPSIGAFGDIDFDAAALPAWEARCRWPPPGEAADSRALFFASFYLEAGRLFAWLGQYECAGLAMRRGLAHCAGSSPGAVAREREFPLRVELAAAALEKGDLAAAATALDALLPQLAPDEQPGFAVRAWETTAQYRIMRGDFGAALALLERCGDLCRRQGFAAAEVSTLLNRAQLLILLNQTVVADELLTRAQTRAAELGEKNLAARAARLFPLAQARRAGVRQELLIAAPVSASWREAVSRGSPAAAGSEDGPGPFAVPQVDGDGFLTRFNDWALGFQQLLDRGSFARARQWLEAMRDIFSTSDSVLIGVRLRALEAMQLFCEHSPEKAAALFTRVRAELRALGLKHELWQAGRFALRLRTRLAGQPGDGVADAELARENEALLEEMSRSLDPANRVYFHLNKWNEEEERIAAQAEALVAEHHAAAGFSWLGRAWARRRLTARLHDLEKEAGRMRATLMREKLRGRRGAGGAGGAESAPAAGTRRGQPWRHSRRSATISFLVLPDRVLVIRAAFLSLTFGVSAVSRLRLREMVAAWHAALAQGERGALEARRLAEEVSTALQFPELLAALPRRVKALRIVPDDVLHGVPFAALITADGRHAVESHAISVATGDAPAVRPSGEPRRRGMLAVGISQSPGGLPVLAHALEEAESVAAGFRARGHPATVLPDAAGTRAAVEHGLCEAAFAHFACHGEFCPDDLARSGLVLCGGEDRAQSELMSLRDLMELDLRGMRHITVASCWSADNYVLPGRWVVCLPRVLLEAGAGGVLGSLWALEDTVTAAFMRRFYELACTLPRHEALRRTQLQCLQNRLFDDAGGDGPNTADMCYWAGLTLYGETGALTR